MLSVDKFPVQLTFFQYHGVLIPIGHKTRRCACAVFRFCAVHVVESQSPFQKHYALRFRPDMPEEVSSLSPRKNQSYPISVFGHSCKPSASFSSIWRVTPYPAIPRLYKSVILNRIVACRCWPRAHNRGAWVKVEASKSVNYFRWCQPLIFTCFCSFKCCVHWYPIKLKNHLTSSIQPTRSRCSLTLMSAFGGVVLRDHGCFLLYRCLFYLTSYYCL